MQDDANVIQYPGYMEPWAPVAVDLKESATSTYFPTGDQVDCGDPDSDPFDYYAFEPGYPAGGTSITLVPVLTVVDVPTTDYPAGEQLDTDDPPPDAFEYTAFEPGYPAAGASITVVPVLTLVDVPTTYYPTGDQLDQDDPPPDAFEYAAFEPGTPVDVDLKEAATTSYYPAGDQLDCDDAPPDAFEYSFEPWVDQGVVAIINDGSTDYDASQPANEELDPTAETAFDPPQDVFSGDDVFLSLVDPEEDFDSIQPNDDDDPIFEFSFEPWVSDIDVPQYFGFDDIEIVVEDDDAVVEWAFEYAFEPWQAIPVNLSDYATDFAAGDQLDDEPDADAFEYQFEAWSSVPAVVLVNDPATDYDSAQPANDDDDPSVEWAIEPWVDQSISTIIDFPDVDLVGFIDEDDAPAIESAMEGIDTFIAPGEFDTVSLTDEDELQLFESSMEAWAAVNIDSPDFTSVVEVDEELDPVAEWQFEGWNRIDITPVPFPDFEQCIWVEPQPDPDCFEYVSETLAVSLTSIQDLIETSTRVHGLPYTTDTDSLELTTHGRTLPNTTIKH